MNPNNRMQCVESLGSNDSADHVVTNSDKESLGLTGECWVICKVVNNEQYVKTVYYLNGSS